MISRANLATEGEAPTVAEVSAQADALFASIGDGAIATDEFGKITRINPAALEILGFSAKEMLGEWFPKVVVAVNEDGVPLNPIDRPITRAFMMGRTIFERMFYRTKSGDQIPVSVSVSPIVLGAKPIGAIEVFRDITREAEIDRMKSEFISLASHQLRTPLSSVKTYAHMLVDGYLGKLEPAQREALKTIIGASNRMNELISMLLNVTRIESGTITLSLKNTTANRLAEEVVKELSVAAAEEDVTLQLHLPKTPYTLKTDTILLKEILSNLVSNSIKYTPVNGSVSLKVTGSRDSVTFIVKDTGMGIPLAVQDQVFTKFFRAPNVVRHETTGTGLGLYLVKGLTERLGGNIRFESEEGKGTTFFLRLPRSHAPKPK